MAADRAEYVAVNRIELNGVGAYNPGDPVDARVVDGPDAWVSRDDVEPSGVIPLPMPARTAPQAAWAAYAVQEGMDPGKAADASRAELVKAYGGK
jgi:hypothetical protein